MRLRRIIAATTASLLVVGLSAVASNADETVPSSEEVAQAEQDVADARRDVATVRADLAVAAAEIESAQVAAATAAEQYNGTLYELDQARTASEKAKAAAGLASSDVDTQRQAYSDALVRTYQSSPSIAGVSAMVNSQGISDFVAQRTTMDYAVDVMDGRYDRFRASSVVADLATDQAQQAEQKAAELEQESRALRDAATAAADAAVTRAAELATERDTLIAELAGLEGVSVDLARQRQEGLERQAAVRAAAARKAQQERDAAAKEAQERAAEATAARERRAAEAREKRAREKREERENTSTPAPRPQAPKPDSPKPSAPKPDTRPPAPSSGAAAAIAFAEAQIGDPYVWGASGPNAWDCSGLTAGAWSAGGKSLPHWSVGQYRESTPIRSSQLRPGDLVFWGNSGDPSSIFHVALYAGDGQIIHAPRTGRPVVKESMYYWRTPDFFARP